MFKIFRALKSPWLSAFYRKGLDELTLYFVMWILAVGIYMFMVYVLEYDNILTMLYDFSALGIVFTAVFVLVFLLISTIFNYIFFRVFHPYRQSTWMMILFSFLLLLINFGIALGLETFTALWWEDVSQQELIKDTYLMSIISTFTSSIYASYTYQRVYARQQERAHQLELENAHQKEVNMQAMLMALKSQVDPHFLFNNFSILSELIDEDKREARHFLDDLSRVYRYKLVNMDQDLIRVDNELQMLRSYVHLLQTRFGEAIQVNIPSVDGTDDMHVPPLAIQLLVENAIKHNAHTSQDPLVVDITIEDRQIVVRNRIHPMVSRPESTGIGLQNLIARYQLLSDQVPQVLQSEEEFQVKLPII